MILAKSAIRHLHLFTSRKKAFKDDGVLQENLIMKLEKGAAQGDVVVSTSTDDGFSDLEFHTHPFDGIVTQGDPESFFHVPTSLHTEDKDRLSLMRFALSEIGVEVSTGPVVDFRLREYLRSMPGYGTVPLLYPGHFQGSKPEWPKPDLKKPNAIKRTSETEKWLYPNGCYCVVRRFSSKEERRRIVASVVHPSDFPDVAKLGFENHLNVFHQERRGLPDALAYGLAAFLNSTSADTSFRRFSGHTQVNATDLRILKYPSKETLTALGRWAMQSGEITEPEIDAEWKVSSLDEENGKAH